MPNTPAHSEILHPGRFVRETVLKTQNISVTDAANLIGISRPNVSNFLNGKVSATPDMAARIERAFKISAKTILDMQAAYDVAQIKGVPANTKSYVPPFLQIKANDIETWASNISARTRLAVLLRTLVHSTGVGLGKVDFPGNNDAQRPGWDGYVEAKEGTPWIPEGVSGWEFGVNQDIKGKADDDFGKSVKAHTDIKARKEITFVFVTPRRWSGKTAWVNAAKSKKLWKDVRAYDASDLEQWLEQSLAGQIWFSDETKAPIDGARSLDKCWEDWSEIASPPLTGSLFTTAIEASKEKVALWLKSPPSEPFIIAADSVHEGLAFVSQLFSARADDTLAEYRDRAIVFDKAGILPRLARGVQAFIPITTGPETARELATLSQKMHCISICLRGTANADPRVTLEPIPHTAFSAALTEMGKNPDEIKRFESESGRSLTVLRRRLSNIPAVKTPAWASDHAIAVNLVPPLLVGAWNSDNQADREALSLLANKSFDDIERECLRLSQIEDAPLWMVGKFRGVVSKIDLLYAVAGTVTKIELERYFSLAQIVLGEDDPALDLPEKDRWFSGVQDKGREFSNSFRNGIAETLVLLSVYGNNLFSARLGINTENMAIQTVRHLLPNPLTSRALAANSRDLPTYAEAAPDAFLSIIEEDLKSPNPASIDLLVCSTDGMFGPRSDRTGLLWALEGLAWNPATLLRASLILARLAEVELNDNLANKPISSLGDIFKSWMPQTAAGKDERVAVIKKIVEKFPSVGWRLCTSLYGRDDVGTYNHKPKWRPDGYGFGEPIRTRGPVYEFLTEIVDITLSRPSYTVDMLCDLISRLDFFDEERQNRVWALIKNWTVTASDEGRATLREKLRVTTLSQRAVRRAKNKESSVALSQIAKDVYAALEPSDLLIKNAWLFKNGWVDESYDEIHASEDFDYKKREERVFNLRASVLREVFDTLGQDGIFALCERGEASYQIGTIMADKVLDKREIIALVRSALDYLLTGNENILARRGLISGALGVICYQKEKAPHLEELLQGYSDTEKVSLMLLAPFCRDTWRLIDNLGEAARNKYWANVHAQWLPEDAAEEGAERLLKANRPRMAFACVHYRADQISARLLFRLMSTIAKEGKEGKEPPDQYRLEEYAIKMAMERLDKSSDITMEEKAGLEFAYIEVLARPWDRDGYGIPNLEKYIERHPELFVQAIVWQYKRKDDGADPTEFQIAQDQARYLARKGWNIIEGMNRIPGHDASGNINYNALLKWVKTVRQACTELSRTEVGDSSLGRLFSSAPVGADGIWPCEAVRDVLEEVQSKDIMRGAHTGLYNSRGVHVRGEGGDQEREIANKYRKWAEALQYSHPFVSSELLMGMVKTYEHEAERNDTEAGVRRRLQ